MLPLVCIDVDGTLVGPSGSPTDAVWAAADAAVARGQHLALSTARGAFGPTFGYAQRLDPSGWHVFHTGAAVVHTGSGEVLGDPLDPSVVSLVEQLEREQGWVLEYYAARDYTVVGDHPLAVEHAGLLGVPFVSRPVADLDGDVLRVQFVVPTTDADAVASAMTEVAGSCTFSAATSPVMPGVSFLTITPPGVTKATAIQRVADQLDCTMADVMMVGDGHNDLDAVAAVGHGVAMGNAEPEVKAVARHHVASVDHDGLAEALELSATL